MKNFTQKPGDLNIANGKVESQRKQDNKGCKC
jgi:hypothetical protein